MKTLALFSASPRVQLARLVAAVATAALSASAHAAADFSKLSDFLTKFQAFMEGPFGKAVVIISIIAAFCAWVFAPKDGIFGPILRVVVAGFAITNAAVWVGQFKM